MHVWIPIAEHGPHPMLVYLIPSHPPTDRHTQCATRTACLLKSTTYASQDTSHIPKICRLAGKHTTSGPATLAEPQAALPEVPASMQRPVGSHKGMPQGCGVCPLLCPDTLPASLLHQELPRAPAPVSCHPPGILHTCQGALHTHQLLHTICSCQPGVTSAIVPGS